MADSSLLCLAKAGAATKPVFSLRPETLAPWIAGLPPAQSAYLAAAGFKAEPGQLALLPGPDGLTGAAFGLGDDTSPYPHGALPFVLPEDTAWHLEPGPFDMAAAVLGYCLGAYQFSELKAPRRGPALLGGAEEYAASLSMAQATWFARDLINRPANLLGPAELAAATRALAERFGAVIGVVAGSELQRDYPTIAAVGRGSDREPLVARFAWHGSRARHDSPLVSLCGKGVCFDSGGYDLKPSAGMLRMKKDMGGAALMLALAQAIMEADLPLRLEVRIGCVENMVSGRAMRPLDVLTTRRGLTVEIGNTDAEGRLVLCDLLAEASDRAPALLIDAATLTGAARVALGPDLPAVFCTDEATAERLLLAGSAAHDPVWRLPLWAGYDSWLASPVADLNNVAGKPMAGAIIAGLFLRRFVAPGTNWIHVDTYAWNDSGRSGRPEGGEALGLRALFGVVASLPSFVTATTPPKNVNHL